LADGTLTFDPGVMSQYVSITIFDDGEEEPDEPVCKIDGTHLSNDTNNSLVHFNGDGNGGEPLRMVISSGIAI